MLVLSRKINETIVIDGRITVEILQVQGDRIRVGIQAPADVKILRGELMPYSAGEYAPEHAARGTPRLMIDRVGEPEPIRYRHHAASDPSAVEVGAA